MASAFASPIDLTPEVAKATEEHLAAHAAATAGEHAALAPAPVVAAYLDDAEEVAAAKAEFQKYFDAAAAGTPLTPVTVPVAPVVVPKVVAPKVAAPVVSYTLPHTYYAGYHPYHYGAYPYHYAAYPYFTGLPVVSAPVVAAKEAVAEE